MKHVVLFLIAISFFGCKKNNTIYSEQPNDNYQCNTNLLLQDLSLNQLTYKFDSIIIQQLATKNAPDATGAMSNNIGNYFHVRFQMGIAPVAKFTVRSQNITALEQTIRSIEYSFQHQWPNGNFDLVIPTGVTYPIPTVVDSASGVSFFLSSLGTGLASLQESSWYNAPGLIAYKNRIEILRPKIEKALQWLISKKDVLEQSDVNAPNRLLFDALAFYSIGKWLNNNTAISIGKNFARMAISKKSGKGYFVELNGWDSSYQGVSISIGFNLFSMLDMSDPLKQELWDCLSCATNWQKSRILSTGEISTKGNTRVYIGGEQFLGQPKTVAWISTMEGFFCMSYFTQNNDYYTIANKVKTFYY